MEEKPEIGSHCMQAGVKAMRTCESHCVRRLRTELWRTLYLKRRQRKDCQQRRLGKSSQRWEEIQVGLVCWEVREELAVGGVGAGECGGCHQRIQMLTEKRV